MAKTVLRSYDMLLEIFTESFVAEELRGEDFAIRTSYYEVHTSRTSRSESLLPTSKNAQPNYLKCKTDLVYIIKKQIIFLFDHSPSQNGNRSKSRSLIDGVCWDFTEDPSRFFLITPLKKKFN